MKLKTEFYLTAIRKRVNLNSILDDRTLLKDFKIIKNNFLFWKADPFLLKFENNDYLFVEIGNKITGKGSLAFTKIDNGEVRNKFNRCSFEKFHMSFPNVFALNNAIYMIPETKRDSCLALYNWDNLHNCFEKEKVLIGNVNVVDSTFFENYIFCYNNSTDLSTLDIYKASKFLDIPYNLFFSIQDRNKKLRAAGNIFVNKNGDLVLPTQNCENGYGKGLIFNKLYITDSKCTVSSMFEISCEVATELMGLNVVGIHTYNSNENYEVIDIKIERFSLIGLAGKIFNKLKTKLTNGLLRRQKPSK